MRYICKIDAGLNGKILFSEKSYISAVYRIQEYQDLCQELNIPAIFTIQAKG